MQHKDPIPQINTIKNIHIPFSSKHCGPSVVKSFGMFLWPSEPQELESELAQLHPPCRLHCTSTPPIGQTCYGPSSWTRIWFCTDTPHNQIQISALTSLNKEQHSYMETTERMQTVRLYLTGAFNCCDQEYWHSNGMAWDASSLLSTLQVEKRYFSFFIV